MKNEAQRGDCLITELGLAVIGGLGVGVPSWELELEVVSLSRKSNGGPRIDTNVPPWPSVAFFEFGTVASCELPRCHAAMLSSSHPPMTL